MDLKVMARRKPGFTAPIAVSLPWNPPGISSKREDRHSREPGRSDDLAQRRRGRTTSTWKIVVNGTYTEVPPGPPPTNAAARRRVRGGRLTVSSRLTKLSIAAPFLTVKFTNMSVEQGKEVDIGVTITKAVDFAGEAKATLLGLPNKVTALPVTLTKDSTEAVFHVKTDGSSPPGEVKNLFCQVVITQNGEPILHNLGAGRLRIDKPLPPPRTAPTAAKTTITSAVSAPSARSRPLSRLEKLRQESKARAKPPSTKPENETIPTTLGAHSNGH